MLTGAEQHRLKAAADTGRPGLQCNGDAIGSPITKSVWILTHDTCRAYYSKCIGQAVYDKKGLMEKLLRQASTDDRRSTASADLSVTAHTQLGLIIPILGLSMINMWYVPA